ncbi:MAG: hypothetical protein OK438_03315 [Thaumarchaeota archaeon]|nr:hypothetical protein [Nitrososphaerota archaeon]
MGSIGTKVGGYAGVRRGIAFYGYLSSMLSLLIVMAVIIWLIYIYLPGGYYIPLSLVALVLFGLVGYMILSRRVITDIEGLNRIFKYFGCKVS